MANTVTQRTLFGGATTKKVVRHIHILSDGDEETDLVIYNNSDFVTDTSKGKLNRLWISGDFTGMVRLEWLHATDIVIGAFGTEGHGYYDYRSFGGIGNSGLDTPTGDIGLTTIALAAADELTIIIEVDQS